MLTRNVAIHRPWEIRLLWRGQEAVGVRLQSLYKRGGAETAGAPFEPLRPPARAQVLPISPLTPKDRKDLEDALAMDVDWVRAAAGGSRFYFGACSISGGG